MKLAAGSPEFRKQVYCTSHLDQPRNPFGCNRRLVRSRSGGLGGHWPAASRPILPANRPPRPIRRRPCAWRSHGPKLQGRLFPNRTIPACFLAFNAFTPNLSPIAASRPFSARRLAEARQCATATATPGAPRGSAKPLCEPDNPVPREISQNIAKFRVRLSFGCCFATYGWRIRGRPMSVTPDRPTVAPYRWIATVEGGISGGHAKRRLDETGPGATLPVRW